MNQSRETPNLPEGEVGSIDDALPQDTDIEGVLPGDSLTNDEARKIAAERRTTVVVLAGMVGSGKTTLLANLYEHFLEEPIGPWIFTGSRTLFGFERRSHGARLASGLSLPKMERTPKMQPPWLHLVVTHERTNNQHDVLMADLSGEWFEDLVDSRLQPSDFPHIFRADHLALVLDGELLADPSRRDLERSRIEILTRLLLETDALATPSALHFVLTKWDLVSRAGDESRDYADRTVRRIANTAGLAEELPYWRVAAQPETPEFPIGHGVATLFMSWMENPSIQKTINLPHLRKVSGWFARRSLFSQILQ